MRITTTKPLFAWDCLEDSPSLRTVKEFLAAVPDAKLLEGRAGGGAEDAMIIPYMFFGGSCC